MRTATPEPRGFWLAKNSGMYHTGETMGKSFDVPILFIIFRRPDTALQVVEALRRVRASRLYITADAPRLDRPNDIKMCKGTREAVLAAIDWPCEIKTYFREVNGGQRYGYADQIDWFFREVEEGIILEDDAIPNDSFFPYCAELLERYRNDPRVMTIDGFFIRDKFPELQIPESYRFSKIPMGYGWATWRRVWALYDVHMKKFNELVDTPQLRKRFGDEGAYQRWRRVWKNCVENDLPVWDTPFVFTVISHNGLCVAPAHNLLSNIGTGPGGTHVYEDIKGRFLNQSTQLMEFPLVHPAKVEADDKADLYLYRQYFGIDKDPLYYYFARPLRNLFPNGYQRVKRFVKN